MQSKYFIGIELPKNLRVEVDKLRKAYYPYGLKNVPAHITLVRPFYLSNKPEILCKEIEQNASTLKRINIDVENFNSFIGSKCVFYAAIKLSKELNDLHRVLTKKVAQYYAYPSSDIRGYTPHITIANYLDRDQLEHIRAQTKNIDLQQSFVADSISLFEKRSGEPYSIYQKFKLATALTN